jgi:hypothetical protein
MASHEERRRFQRQLPEELSAELLGDGVRTPLGPVRDLSVSGIFVRTQVTVAEGARLLLLVGSARSAAAFRVEARVVRLVPGVGFGAMFLNTDDDTRHWIALCLSQLGDGGPQA